MKKLIFTLLFALSAPLSAQSTTSVSASHVADPSGIAISSGLLCFEPVDATDKTTGFRVGSVQVTAQEKCYVVSNGVMQSGATVVPTPAGVYYHIRVRNRQQTTTVYRDFGMTTITGSSWTLDSYDPSMAVLPVQTLTVGTVTELSPGSAPTATISGSNPLLLNLGIPQGYSGTGAPTYVPVTYSATPTFNGSTSGGVGWLAFDLTLTADVTSSTVSNIGNGQIVVFFITQDGSGGHNFVWPTNVKNPPSLSLAASSTTTAVFVKRNDGNLYPSSMVSNSANAVIASGAVDGVNNVFTFQAPASPTPSVSVFANGIYQFLGSDYTLVYSGSNTWTITFTVNTPIAGAVVAVRTP